MKKATRIATHIFTVICILVAGVILCQIISTYCDFGFTGVTGQGTRLEFIPYIGSGGFNREVEIFTGDNANIIFSGKITVDGTANISIISNDDGVVAYYESYTAVKAESIQMDVSDLTPNSYYTLVFSSTDAQKAHLILTTNLSLREPPQRPSKT